MTLTLCRDIFRKDSAAMKFLQYDSPFMTACRRLTDYMILGWLWIIVSIPIVTFGVATTAMLRTAQISIRQNDGTIWKPFWKYFRQEFKQATILWLVEILVVNLLVIDIVVIRYLGLPMLIQQLTLLMCIFVFCWVQLWFGYQSRIKDKLGIVLLNAFRMTVSNFGRTLLMAVLAILALAAGYFSIFFFSPLILLIPGIYITAYTALLRGIFRRYDMAEEEMPEEVQ